MEMTRGVNRQTKFWIENIRRGFECGHLGEPCCDKCDSLHKCLAVRRAMKYVIRSIKGKDVK